MATKRLVRLTDAPEAYDGFGTRTIACVGKSNRVGATGNHVRLVSIEVEHDQWQTDRYSSGTYMYTILGLIPILSQV